MNDFEQPKLPDTKPEGIDAVMEVYNLAEGIVDPMTEEIAKRCQGEGKYTSVEANLNSTMKNALALFNEIPDDTFKTDTQLQACIVQLKELLRSIKTTQEHYELWYKNVANENEKAATLSAFDVYLSTFNLVKKQLESIEQKYSQKI